MKLGEIYKNGLFGICGNITNKENLNLTNASEMEVALRSEIKEGKAYIICELENGKKEQYEIEIERIYISNNYDNQNVKGSNVNRDSKYDSRRNFYIRNRI